VLTAFKEYPHTDTDERAAEVAELVIACVEGAGAADDGHVRLPDGRRVPDD
jgi:microcystin degradation protein MlrC